MHPYPHVYVASAAGGANDAVAVRSPGLPDLQTSPPPQFGGPGGLWSPETLLCAAIANCFILTFRALSRAARLEWHRLECRVEGKLERADGVTRFTRYETVAELVVPDGTDQARATALLEKSEHHCLISNSLKGERTLAARVLTSTAAPPGR